MTHFRLRTQLFIATLLIICGLTGALLLIIRHTVSVETERQVRDGTEASVAEHLALVAGNQIALATGDTLIASTLSPKDEAAMQRRLSELSLEGKPEEHEIVLATDEYAFSSVLLHGALPSPVRCYVMMPLGPVNSFMSRLNRTIFILGASAV